MENLLIAWPEVWNQKRIPIATNNIMVIALKLFSSLKEYKFTIFSASRGRFEKFKARTGSIRWSSQLEAASGDKDAATKFPECFKEIIKKNNYHDRQICYVRGTGLCWKKIVSRIFWAKNEELKPGYKVCKHILILLLGGNAKGNLKLKPMLIYHSPNPRV